MVGLQLPAGLAVAVALKCSLVSEATGSYGDICLVKI